MIPGGSGGNITPFIEEWKGLTGIDIQLVEVPNTELYSKAMQEAVAKTGQYDLIIGPVYALPDFSEAGLAKDITDYVEAHQPELDTGPYRIPYPFSDFGCKYNNEYRALYADADNWALYMRKDWLEDPEQQAAFKEVYGRDLEAPNTWDEYDDLITFFTQPENDRYGSLEYRSPFYTKWQWMQRFCSKGAMYFDQDMVPQCNSAEGVAALEELIATEHTMPKEAFTNGWSENYNQYGLGNVFSTLSWPSFFRYNNDPEISEAVAGNLMSVPVPGTMVDGELIRASVNAFGWLYVVSDHSNNPELAYLFAQWHTAPDISDRAIPKNGGYFDPTRTNHFREPGPEMEAKYTQAWLDAAWEQIGDVIPDFV
ncbi:MAG: extracellular solute-binding protein, partial [Hyphomicrobiales bacterium]